MNKPCATLLFLCWSLPVLASEEWAQDGGNAQRTGCTAEEPELPWKFLWAWNGPDENGGTSGHKYHQPRPYSPWEARVCVGGGLVFAPAGVQGLYALRTEDGSVAWHFTKGHCQATPAFDAASGSLFVGTSEGDLWKLDVKTGREHGQVRIPGKLDKALLLDSGHIYALTLEGVLHQIETESLRIRWRYLAGSPASTLPSYSATRDVVIFCSDDLQVHAVNAADGTVRWKQQPSGKRAVGEAEFTAGWPVVADQRGIVLVRLVFPSINTTLWCGGGTSGRWPKTCAGIRARLVANPQLKNLFALNLNDGTEAFIPAIGAAGVEDLADGSPFLRMPSLPVIRNRAGHDIAYTHWRHGDSADPQWDARWDSHLGEMVLDATSVAGQQPGDVRFVQFEDQGGWVHVTDESCPLTMAGETLFYAHWDVCTSARLLDRSPSLGLLRTNPISTESRPPVVRHLHLAPTQLDAATRWASGGFTLMDKRYLNGPGWWVYANQIDPPTPKRDGYSEGILPRITLVANGVIIIQGNGADLMVLKHSGK